MQKTFELILSGANLNHQRDQRIFRKFIFTDDGDGMDSVKSYLIVLFWANQYDVPP